MQSIKDALVANGMFRNLTEQQLDAVASLGQDIDFADGAALMSEGEPANTFFLIREGFVALQTETPAGAITIETLHNGDPVGWSWLIEPFLTHFDARSHGVTHAVQFDAATLRKRWEEDPVLGYELMRSFAAVIVERLHATRIQLLDTYVRGTVA